MQNDLDTKDSRNGMEIFWNMVWLLAILTGILSVPLVAVYASRRSGPLPGIVEFTIPEKRWHSMTGYDCVDKEHYAVCTLPKEK